MYFKTKPCLRWKGDLLLLVWFGWKHIGIEDMCLFKHHKKAEKQSCSEANPDYCFCKIEIYLALNFSSLTQEQGKHNSTSVNFFSFTFLYISSKCDLVCVGEDYNQCNGCVSMSMTRWSLFSRWLSWWELRGRMGVEQGEKKLLQEVGEASY